MKKILSILCILGLMVLPIFAQTKKTTKTSTKKTAPTKKTTSTIDPIPGPTIVKVTPTPATTVVQQNTPANLTGLEAEILAEINTMRKNPAEYAKIFEEYLKTNKDKSFFYNGQEYLTNEGKVPVEELIATLKQTAPLPEFKAIEGLTKAAKDHAQDLVKNNMQGHKGSDGSYQDTRVAKYGFANAVYENISYYTKTAKRVVMTMLIDDGTTSRNHRKNLMNPKLKVVGIATGENKAVESFCVIVLTDTFVESKGIRSF